jgi:hypothetical protein
MSEGATARRRLRPPHGVACSHLRCSEPTLPRVPHRCRSCAGREARSTIPLKIYSLRHHALHGGRMARHRTRGHPAFVDRFPAGKLCLRQRHKHRAGSTVCVQAEHHELRSDHDTPWACPRGHPASRPARRLLFPSKPSFRTCAHYSQQGSITPAHHLNTIVRRIGHDLSSSVPILKEFNGEAVVRDVLITAHGEADAHSSSVASSTHLKTLRRS